ncbi:MAG: hypothetical protein GX444_11515 [Myxococcales bacterium]|nr:hypothetical protein [Myxococcales bacterium]
MSGGSSSSGWFAGVDFSATAMPASGLAVCAAGGDCPLPQENNGRQSHIVAKKRINFFMLNFSPRKKDAIRQLRCGKTILEMK